MIRSSEWYFFDHLMEKYLLLDYNQKFLTRREYIPCPFKNTLLLKVLHTHTLAETQGSYYDYCLSQASKANHASRSIMDYKLLMQNFQQQ